jgi:hypothetical protein
MAWKTVCPFCGYPTDKHAPDCGREIGARGMHALAMNGYNLTETDLADWSRWPEVVGFAGVRGCSIADAVERLVNMGLSNWNGR